MRWKIKQSKRIEQAWDVASQTDPDEEWIMVLLAQLWGEGLGHIN